MNQLLSSDGLTSQISDIVAEASMQLPSLSHAYDADFLRHQTAKAVSIFLRELEAGEQPEVRNAFNTAQSNSDPVRAGILLHESLGAEGSEVRVQSALAIARVQILKTVADDYGAFIRDIASKN